MSETFDCARCGEPKPIQKNGGTGYANTDDGRVCYDCCAIRDKQTMVETNKIALYLTLVKDDPLNPQSHVHWEVTNWPGTLRFKVRVRQSDHNFAGKNGRCDAWFIFDGSVWHGVNIGDNQICRCKRTKEKADPKWLFREIAA